MSNDNSDYNKPRTNMFDLLPEVYQSDTNRSIFENLFNRFLTKQETKRVSGYIGEGNPNAITKRQIQEFNVHRQGYQLQPILYNKVGSVEWMASWKDLLNQIERQGVDPDLIQEWMSLLQFNWVPPIDLDKLINYRDYYWADGASASSSPQYVTIRSRCATAISFRNFVATTREEMLNKNGGNNLRSIRAGEVENNPGPYEIFSITQATNEIVVVGDVSSELNNAQLFEVAGTGLNNATYEVAGIVSYDSNFNRSTIPVVAGSLNGDESLVGQVELIQYDTLIVAGEFERPFDPGFVFYYKESTNPELNNAFWEVVASRYDEAANETFIRINKVFSRDTVDGILSMDEQLSLANAQRDCQCSGSVGWDIFQWDDNPMDPSIWEQTSGDSLQTLIDSISNTIPPTGTAGDQELWWDTTADVLYQYGEDLGAWKIIWNNFSLIVNQTLGLSLWDLSESCGTGVEITPSADQWIRENKWLHKTDVGNFAAAKQASIPIVEFGWDLEINEWNYTTFKWRYRDQNFDTWEDSDVAPEYPEIVPITYYGLGSVPREFVIDERYGDLTSYFIPGRQFMVTGNSQIFEVESSQYTAMVAGEPGATHITVTEDIVPNPDIQYGSHAQGPTPAAQTINTDISQVAPLRPTRTSVGDGWRGYHVHWLLVEDSDVTVAVPHQPPNYLAEIPSSGNSSVHSSGLYDIRYTYYAQEMSVLTSTITSTFELSANPQLSTARSLKQRALLGRNDVRVYINGERQYGTYTEDSFANKYVGGITFLPGYEPNRFDVVRIEVGEATPSDFGWAEVEVRTEEDDTLFQSNGTVTKSLIAYRRAEQIKTATTQYPLFDMYHVDGSPLNTATPLFCYKTDPTAPINTSTGLRLVVDDTGTNFTFEQHLVEETDGVMYAYRDYANRDNDIWVDTDTNIVRFWNGLGWSESIQIGTHYIRAVVQATPPPDGSPIALIDGAYWMDTTNRLLKRRELNEWAVVPDVLYSPDDPSLQSIWRKGLNDELYIPQKRDWVKRTLAEYNDELVLYVEELKEEILLTTNVTDEEATTQALTSWFEKEANHLSPAGTWVGDWEVPDPLYFNHNRENRKEVLLSEILTHFQSIIEAQPKIPGYSRSKANMFHLIGTNEVNYGLGGKIKEYNHAFDTFLSAMFTNEVSPRTLFEFAQDQYEVMLNNLGEIYRKNSVDLFTDTSDESIADLSGFITKAVIDSHEQNDATGLIYGDTSAFIEQEGFDDIGVRNWIATLPIFGIMAGHRPHKVIDLERDINQVIHHDGHRADYILPDGVVESIIREVLRAPDVRTQTTPSDEPGPFGIVRDFPQLPPNTIDEFETEFDTLINNRRGAYWYYINGDDRTLYRLVIQEIGTDAPASSLPDGTLWLDLNPNIEALRVKTTNPNTGQVTWDVPLGLTAGQTPVRLHNGSDPNDVRTSTVSAWQPLDLNDILTDAILETEDRLFEVTPEYESLRYDFEALRTKYPELFSQYLRDQFDAHLSEKEIVDAFGIDYVATDPFTWNYRYSTFGRPFETIDSNVNNQTITISGKFASVFDALIPGSRPFYIKNGGANDGTKTVAQPCVETCLSGTPSSCPANLWTTTIFINEPVNEFEGGVAYTGILPSPQNTGGETGGDWRDYYEKLYGTPYPHLEPWKLQGFAIKPLWWDEEYAVTDTARWGNRKWAYKHGFDIVGVNVARDVFEIEGDFREVFPTHSRFDIDESADHGGEWQVGSLGAVDMVNTGPAGIANLELFDNNLDRTADFPAGMRFSVISNGGALVAQLTVSAVVFTGPPYNRTVIVVEEAIDDATDFDLFGGATYDAISNRTTILVNTNVDDITVPVVSGRIDVARKTPTHTVGLEGYGMWRNIRLGYVPEGRTYPNGITAVTGIPNTDRVIHGLEVDDLPTYRYMSVNIDNDTITTGGTFEPDDVLPPYWDFPTHFGTANIQSIDKHIRSLFAYQSTEVTSESTNFIFGDAGPVEWEWRQSSQYLYDLFTVAFRIDPIRFFHDVYGPEFYTIGGLYIDKDKKRTLSHVNNDFHGDIRNTNEVVKYNGTNQWYINYLRRAGIDLSMSDFRTSWTDWSGPLTYQFSSFVDTPSLSVAHRQVCISEFDYTIASKRSFGVEDYWADSFDVYTLSVPPRISRYDNEFAWQFEIHTKPPAGRDISYYDVQRYQFYADPNTGLMTIYSWPIDKVDFFNDAFRIRGDQTELFIADRAMSVVDSTGNDGDYTIESSVYDVVTDQTLISVNEDVNGTVDDGRVILDYRQVPWEDGDTVVLSTHETLPIPLNGDNETGVYLYFIIRQYDSNGFAIPNTFRLARTKADALANSYVEVTNIGRGDHFVGKIYNTFDVPTVPTFWKNYVVDTTNVLTMTAPQQVTGIQNVVNIMNGYWQYQKDQGWRYNDDNTLRDPTDPSYAVSWLHELRRFIKYVHQVRSNNTKIEDRYPVTVDHATDDWTIEQGNAPYFVTGDPVTIHSTNRVYPSPLVHGGRYYIIRDDVYEFRLAATKSDARKGIAIDIQEGIGVADLFLMKPSVITKASAKFEINPFRQALWFAPERGVVSNLLGSNATVDTFSTPILADQYGRPLGRSNVRIFREDKITKITAEDLVDNDVELTGIFQDPYNYIHLGIVHLFIDTYEHALVFNDNTTEGSLLYDPFVGLNVTKFEMLFNKQIEFTQRPNVGGQYFSTENNQGADLRRNIEASIEDLRNLYDTYRVIEANDFIKQSRNTLGYEGTTDYLDNLNLSAKSQFAFWRGQIQHKGAMNSIQSFVNSRRFIDAKIDEYWAVKIPGAEFGSTGDKEYIGMWLFDEDARNNEFRLQFLDLDNICDAGYGVNEFDGGCGYAFPNDGDGVAQFDEGWTPISITDESRWVNQPDQLIKLVDNGGALYFDLALHPRKRLHLTDVPADDNTYRGLPYDVPPHYVRHDFKSDYTIVTGRMDTPTNFFYDVPTPTGKTVTIPSFVPNTGMITVFVGSIAAGLCPPTSVAAAAIAGCAIAGNTTDAIIPDTTGEKQIVNVDYEEVQTTGFFSTELQFAEDLTGKTVRVVYGTGTLIPDVHYNHYTSNIIEFLHDEIVDGSLVDVTMWGMDFDHASLNPHKIIDAKSETVITPVQYWDPARGHHYHNAIHIVDLQIDTDPVFYSVTPETDADQRLRIANEAAVGPMSRTSEEPWRTMKVGTTWMNTNELEYLPYYDYRAITNLEDRLLLWGELSDWSDIKIRTWVESDNPPESYDGEGTVEQTLFENVGTVGSPVWVIARNKYEDFDVSIDAELITGTEVQFEVDPAVGFANLTTNENIELFVNGQWLPEYRLGVQQWRIDSATQFTIMDHQATDRIRLVQFVPGTRPADIDPDGTNEALQAAAIEATELLLDYQYVEREYYDTFGLQRSKYYYWAVDMPTSSDRLMSPANAVETLKTIPVPYVVYHDIAEPKKLKFEEITTGMPWRFTKAIVRGIRNIVDSDRRYVLRWTRDETLRDTLDTGRTPLEKKDLHEQWELIRPEMPQTIPRWLWDKVTESIIGFTLSDSYAIENTVVPSLNRELYDETYGTDTRYGLGTGQAFTDGQMALATIQAYLNDPGIDFAPVDINVFFQTYDFDTTDPDSIVEIMNALYNTFPYIHVNRMFFNCLLDAFSVKGKYEDIFKTSMIALHGIRPFQVGGIFDD